MKDDLLILKLLKIPVTIIKYLSKFFAMMTYLPNYLIILVLDSIIFNITLSSTFAYYIVSWPLRFVALIGVIAIFCGQFYGIYMLLSISHFHWGIQLVVAFIAFQGMLALMRHGYLTMIKKYSPTKLKSPKQHATQLVNICADLLNVFLALINILLVINLTKTFSYKYNPNIAFNYLKYIIRLIHKSILDIIKLFYIKIFFRLFPWRYTHSLHDVRKQENNILQLTVLLTLLFWITVLDLIFFLAFGIYCAYIHPRKRVYRSNLYRTHQKFKVTGQFMLDSTSQMMQCLALILCMPFKYKYAKEVLGLVLAKQNTYQFHYWGETVFVLKLALVKIPSLLCELILLISIYKFKKVRYLMKQKQKKMPASANESNKLFESKYNTEDSVAAPNLPEKSKKNNKPSKNLRERRHIQREYLVFKCFGSLIKQIPFLLLVPICTVVKPWNVGWLKFIINTEYDVRIYYVTGYFFKNVHDSFTLIACLLSIFVLGFYDPIKQKKIVQKYLARRRQLIDKLPRSNGPFSDKELEFYSPKEAVTPKILGQNIKQIREDVFFLPLFILARLTLISSMDCPSPSNSVELFQSVWKLFYIQRVKRSGYYQQYLRFLENDEAAGVIKNQRERLRFWKFAHKSIRHRIIAKILSALLPRRRAQKAIANAKVQKNFSAIANHYWYRYNITMSLLNYFIYFVIELIVSVIGALIFFPLTLWRMPTFVILFKTHKYNRKLFFSIIFKMYKEMLLDLAYLAMRIFIFILFPRACFNFYFKTALRYTKQGTKQFQDIQRAKLWYLTEKILKEGFYLYALFFKIIFIKVFWVRKRDMNQQLKQNQISLSRYAINFLMTPQKTPNIKELKRLYDTHHPGHTFINDEGEVNNNSQENDSEEKWKDINELGFEIENIVKPYFLLTIEDLPYLTLMVFILFTLPWRVFYIKNALFSMRDDKTNRREFIKLLKMISKDYQCILMYILLIFSIVKTKRAFQLFYRNFKLNFYVGTLKYSHLKQLRAELKQAVHFYQSLFIVFASCFFGPYRIHQIYTSVKELYKKYWEEKEQAYKNQKLYDTTVKQGKSLQLITTIGHNSLQHVFRFLDTRQLTVMTKVSKYMYDSIKENDSLWKEHWERVYASKYPGTLIKNDINLPNYNAMCVQTYKQEHLVHMNNGKSRFYNLAIRQFEISTFETLLDLKVQMQRRLSPTIYNKIFHCLRYSQLDGYGPEQNWPRPDDNQQYLDMFNIVRRQIVEHDESQAAISWILQRPIQIFMRRINRFYQTNTHRRKKQLAFIFFNITAPIFILACIIWNWSWIWTIDMFIGYKLIGCVWFYMFCLLFIIRYQRQFESYAALRPFDLIQDVKYYYRVIKQWIYDKSVKAGNFILKVIYNYVVKPLRYVGRKIGSGLRWAGGKVVYASNLLLQKVAKPLYIKISNNLRALWVIIKKVCRTFYNLLITLLNLVKEILKNVYLVLFEVVKSISKFYSNMLEHSLKLALSYGNVGQLIFTIIVIMGMISPSLFCYFFYSQRWFIIFSTLMTMVLMVTGYKHLNRMKERILQNK